MYMCQLEENVERAQYEVTMPGNNVFILLIDFLHVASLAP